MNIGILGGSFNPIHIGHCILASYISQFVPSIDEVWLCVSPQNPLKDSADPAYDNHEYTISNVLVCDTSSRDAKYWWRSFLELKELRTNELNTINAYKAIKDKVISPITILR